MNIWSLDHWNIGILEQWNIWTFEHLNIWTFEHWNIGTLNLWNIGTFEHLKIWMFKHWNIWTFEHLIIWTLEHQKCWTFEHLNISTFEHLLDLRTIWHQTIWHRTICNALAKIAGKCTKFKVQSHQNRYINKTIKDGGIAPWLIWNNLSTWPYGKIWTKRKEKNTEKDWTIEMGRMVERFLFLLQAFAPSALRLYCMYFFLSLFVNFRRYPYNFKPFLDISW